MFWCFRSIVHCFQCFVRGLSPFGKKFPMNSPTPRKLLPLNPPLPLGISNDLPWRVGGGGGGKVWIFSGTTQFFFKITYASCDPIPDPHKKINEYMEKYSYFSTNVQPKNNAHARTSVCIRKMATSCGFWRGACA